MRIGRLEKAFAIAIPALILLQMSLNAAGAVSPGKAWFLYYVATLAVFGYFACYAVRELRERLSRQTTWLVAALLTIMSVTAFTSLLCKSPTWDEPTYVTTGIRLWRWGPKLEFSLGHPPFAKLLFSLPAMAVPAGEPPWLLEALVDLCRLPAVALTVVAGLYVLLWATELYGERAGLAALMLFCFSPNILAHGRLAALDMPLACTLLIASYHVWRCTRSGGVPCAIVAGTACGLALATKAPALCIFAVVPFLFLLNWREIAPVRWFCAGVRRQFIGRISAIAGRCFVIFAAALFVLGLSHGFDRIGLHRLGPVVLPLPEVYAGYIKDVRQFQVGQWQQEATTGALAKTVDFVRRGGPLLCWKTFLLKVPLPLLILLATGIVLTAARRLPAGRQEASVMTVAGVFLAYFCLQPGVRVGFRVLLPALPFLFIWSGRTILALCRGGRAWRVAAGALLTWLVLESTLIYPHYLAYFNELAGGPDHGWRYLGGSNLDWGQDLKGLAEYVKRNDLRDVHLAYFGSLLTDRMSVSYHAFPHKPVPERPTAGLMAVSAEYLQKPDSPLRWLRRHEPFAKIGYSIFLYRIRTEDVDSRAP